MTTPQNKTIEITFNSIFIPDDENSRSKLKKIDELAESIKEHGLLEPLVVVNGGKGEQKYRLKAGYRRAAALKKLRWGDKLVAVTVAEEDDGPIKTLVENIQREDLPAYDLAQTLHDLETGDYNGPYERDEEGKAKKYTKQELMAKTGLGLAHLTNLIRAHKNLGKEAKNAWRRHDVPVTVVFKWAAMSEEEQEAAVALWTHRNEQRLAEDKGAGAKAKGKKGKKGKKGAKAKGGGEERTTFIKGAKAAVAVAWVDVLKWKLEHEAKGVTEKAAIEAQIGTIEFLAQGKGRHLPNVTKADEKAYEKWYAEQLAAEKAAKKGGEEEAAE
jgi:ParB/RepB/Spo0J family partition protein